MKNLDELSGIIKGINFDGIINEKEVNYLRCWNDQNKDFAISNEEKGLVRIIETSLKDGFITEGERKAIQNTLNRLMNSTKDSEKIYTELIGIIEGIISDDSINTLEIKQLRNWYDRYGDELSAENVASIKQVVDRILEDGIVTFEEKSYLLGYLQEKIHYLKMNSKIENFRVKIKKGENIGIDLILLLGDNSNVESIHKQAEEQLKRALSSYTGFSVRDPEIVVLSLSLIALVGYDSIFYNTVRETYKCIYEKFSQQKIEGLIRSILSKFSDRDEKSHGRIINVVLEQSIVPIYYLPNFFEFIFDIYEHNFQYNLPENLDSELMFIYEGLFSDMNRTGDSFVVNATKKTYKLIQSTKDLIIKKHNYEPLIQLSKIIIHIIDNYFWGKAVNLNNKYLSYGFEKWAGAIKDKKELRKNKPYNKSSWKPEFFINNEKVMLSIPQHKIKANKGYQGLRIELKNDNELLYENDMLDVREIIGGYQVFIPHIVVPIPLGKFNYCVYINDEIIYDSGTCLYRDFIVFNQNSGVELKNYTDYTGDAILCTINSVESAREYYENQFYKLSILRVQLGESIFIQNSYFHFSKIGKPEIFGEQYYEANIESVATKKIIPIFKKVQYVIFDDAFNVAELKDYKLFLNNKEYQLEEFDYSIQNSGGISKYIISFSFLKPGIYHLKVIASKRTLLNEEFVYDPIISYHVDKLTNKEYLISLESTLVLNNKKNYEIDFSQYEKESLLLEYNNQKYYWQFVYDYQVYSVSNSFYQTFDEDLWIYDLNADSNIKVLLKDIDRVSVYSSRGNLIDEDINFTSKGYYLSLPIGFLISYKNAYDYISIFFIRKGELIGMIRCNNRCNICKNGISLNFDHINLEMAISTQFEGKGKIYYEIYNDNNLLIKKSSFAENGETIKITFERIDSFKRYTIYIYEKANALLSLRKQEPLKVIERVLYDQKDFVGKILKIKKAYYSIFFEKRLIDRSCILRTNYVYITKQVAYNTFQGKIFAKTDKGIYWLSHINPVEVEIISDDINENIEILITNEGDGLLLDSRRKNIMNDLEDNNAPCIDSYIMNLQPEEGFN